MGARGPKPGWRARVPYEPAADVPVLSVAASTSMYVGTNVCVDAAALGANLAALSFHDRDNPNKLTGDALKELAFRRGMARTSLDGMSDAKIREQLRYIDSRQYEDA